MFGMFHSLQSVRGMMLFSNDVFNLYRAMLLGQVPINVVGNDDIASQQAITGIIGLYRVKRGEILCWHKWYRFDFMLSRFHNICGKCGKISEGESTYRLLKEPCMFRDYIAQVKVKYDRNSC